MIKSLLEQHNHELYQDLQSLIQLVSLAPVSDELLGYKAGIISYSQALLQNVNVNLALIKIGKSSIYKDILSRTQQTTQRFQLLSSMLVIPIINSKKEDRICLQTIHWLHNSLPETKQYPAVFLSGNFAVRPFQDIAPLYYFPTLEQRSLLYQPLLFHEYGHFLYQIHRQEMDDLVQDLQAEIDEVLMPMSQRNDRFSDAMAIKRQMIAYTWYSWAQELFCDAVGFTIGGPCFVRSFSRYLLLRDPGNFYRDQQDLENSSHPVTWLRIHNISKRAEKAGFKNLAEEIEKKWFSIAQMMNIPEDYHGFYDEAIDDVINRTIEDMLIEASPRKFSQMDISSGDWDPSTDSPIRLFCLAWQKYSNDYQNYSAWEENQINLLLASH